MGRGNLGEPMKDPTTIFYRNLYILLRKHRVQLRFILDERVVSIRTGYRGKNNFTMLDTRPKP